MLLDLVVKSVSYFQEDCAQLCAKHYPTVHNRGMNEHHLALAFARRMQHTLQAFDFDSMIAPLDALIQPAQAHHYRISSSLGTVWVLSHHLVSASRHCREKLLADIACWKKEYAYAIQPTDLLFLVSDHWLNRSQGSRSLLDWWMNELPSDQNLYMQQGITLSSSEQKFTQQLEQHFAISPCYLKYGHPLFRSNGQHVVRKYLQLYAVLQWSN